MHKHEEAHATKGQHKRRKEETLNHLLADGVQTPLGGFPSLSKSFPLLRECGTLEGE